MNWLFLNVCCAFTVGSLLSCDRPIPRSLNQRSRTGCSGRRPAEFYSSFHSDLTVGRLTGSQEGQPAQSLCCTSQPAGGALLLVALCFWWRLASGDALLLVAPCFWWRSAFGGARLLVISGSCLDGLISTTSSGCPLLRHRLELLEQVF